MRSATIKTVAFDARYINDQYHGIGRHAYNLLDALTRLDPNRRYIAYYYPGYRNTRFDLAMLGQRPNVELRPVQIPLYGLGEQLAWPGLLAQSGADLFHSPYVLLPLLSRVKMVMTVHDLIFERHPEYRTQGLLQKLYRPVLQMGIKRAERVLTVSEASGHDIQEYYHVDPAHINVIYNGVDPIFQPVTDPLRIAAVRARYGLPEHFVLTVGAGRPHKNVETLVEAFARLDPAIAPMLVIGGEHDPRFPDLVGMRIAAHGLTKQVIRLGMVQEADLPVVYSLADAFVFPSRIEGFGIPPLEAMACGTPVVASMTPAVAEAVGDAALTFETLDPEQLAIALRRVLTETPLKSMLKLRGLERARTFTWERVAQETLQAYTSIESTTRIDAKESHVLTL